MTLRILAVAALASALAATPVHAAGPTIPFRGVVLQGLDKITARVSRLELPLGQTLRFGTLEITARACYETPPTEAPESAAFLEIVEHDTAQALFKGWMYASSPALSALEHPVYDVWVLDCESPLDKSAPENAPPSGGG